MLDRAEHVDRTPKFMCSSNGGADRGESTMQKSHETADMLLSNRAVLLIVVIRNDGDFASA